MIINHGPRCEIAECVWCGGLTLNPESDQCACGKEIYQITRLVTPGTRIMTENGELLLIVPPTMNVKLAEPLAPHPKCHCGAPAKHGDQRRSWPDRKLVYRLWCEEHTPWSGHYEDCPGSCKRVMAAAANENAKYDGYGWAVPTQSLAVIK